MNKHRKILNQIAEIRKSHSQMENIFRFGSCLNLFCILHSFYPEAKAWFDSNHIITEIDGKFYDINGEANNEGYDLYTEVFATRKRLKRSFRGMYKSEFKLTSN